MKNFLVYVLLLLSFLSQNVFASIEDSKLIKIFHTNDLHSHFTRFESDSSKGGYGVIKTVLEERKAKGKKEGIPSLYFDAGDFSEGSIYYMADRGLHSFKMLEGLSPDAVTVGNHEYLIGIDEFDQLVGKANPKFPLLAANWSIGDSYKNLDKSIKPYKEFEINGVKVAVLGLTTDEIFYKWRVAPTFIGNPIITARYWIPKLRKQNRVVIVLSHLGVEEDEKLVRAVPGIDLIIGGHSHTLLKRPMSVHGVPIFQLGAFATYLGEITLAVSPKEIKMVSYDVHHIGEMDRSRWSDPVMEEMIKNCDSSLNFLYGDDFLNTKVGMAEGVLKSNERRSSFSDVQALDLFVAKAALEAGKGDAAIHFSDFAAEVWSKSGPITRRDLFNIYPRVFNFDQTKGWDLWNARVPGVLIKYLIQFSIYFNVPIYFSGITFEVEKTGGRTFILSNIKIHGEQIHRARMYTITLPQGIVQGMRSVAGKYSKLVISRVQSLKTSMWETLERELEESPVITSQDYKPTESGVSEVGPCRSLNIKEQASTYCDFKSTSPSQYEINFAL